MRQSLWLPNCSFVEERAVRGGVRRRTHEAGGRTTLQGGFRG